MEFGFRVLVLVELGSHILCDLLLLRFHGVDDLVVASLLFNVDTLDLSHPLTKSSELLDARSELGLLFLDITLNLLDESGQFLEGSTLVVVKLLFKFRNTLNLLLYGGVAGDSSLLLEVLEELVNVSSARLENLDGSVEDGAFCFDFIELLHHGLILRVFLTEVCRVLSEIVALHVFLTLDLGVVIFLLLHGLLEGHLLHLELLELFLLLVLLLTYGVGLTSVDGQLVISRFWSDLSL